MKLKSITLVSSLANDGEIDNLGTAAYKDAGNNVDNVPVIMPNGKLDSSILPSLQVMNVFNADSQQAMIELNASAGDICIRTDENKTYILTDEPASVLSNWTQISLISSVESVNNKTGIVNLNAMDVGAVPTNESIVGNTKCKITYDNKGLVTKGEDLTSDDIPIHEHSAKDITSGILGVTYGGTGANDKIGVRTNLDIYSKLETEALIPTDLSQLSNKTTNYINNTQLQEAIQNMGNVFTLKGSVSTYTSLPQNNNLLGDVYYVKDTGKSYVWMYDGAEEKWEELGSSVDLYDCVKKSELLNTTGSAEDNTMSQLAITNSLNTKANSVDIPTQLTDLSGVLPISQGGTGGTSFNNGNFIIGNGTDGFTSLQKVPISKGGTNGVTVTEARTNFSVYTKECIYYNESGTYGTITLSQSANNYNWIEIYYFWGSIFNSVVIIPNNIGSRTINLYLIYNTNSYNQLLVRSTLIYLNGQTITWNRNKLTTINISGGNSVTNEYISIHSIYGFKH